MTHDFYLGAMVGITLALGVAVALVVAYVIGEMNRVEPVRKHRQRDKRWSAPR